ncbi:putative phospholipase A2 [Diplonema papillatum]|nr:putative phospholipase A2 [Diplonema papillatum]
MATIETSVGPPQGQTPARGPRNAASEPRKSRPRCSIPLERLRNARGAQQNAQWLLVSRPRQQKSCPPSRRRLLLFSSNFLARLAGTGTFFSWKEHNRKKHMMASFLATTAAVATGLAAVGIGVGRWVVAPTRNFPEVYGRYKKLGTRKLRVPGGPQLQCVYPLEVTGEDTQKTSNSQGSGVHYADWDSAGGLGYAFSSRFMQGVLVALLGLQQHPDAVDGPVLEKDLPVVFFSHGLYGSSDMYLQLCREMASLGILVIAINHEDGTSSALPHTVPYKGPPKELNTNDRDAVRAFRKPFFDKRQAEVQAVYDFVASQRQANDALFRRADIGRVALAGHSFGAASTVRNGASFTFSPRCFLLFDMWALPLPADAKVNVPAISFMSNDFINNEQASFVKPITDAGVKYSFMLPKSRHALWSDWAWIIPPRLNVFTHFSSPADAHLAWVDATDLFLKHHLLDELEASPIISETENRKKF